MSIVCSNCGHNNQADARYCDECGVELVTETLPEENESSVFYHEDLDLDLQTKDFAANLNEKFDELDETMQPLITKGISSQANPETSIESNQEAANPLNSSATVVELSHAALICQDTDTRYELPPGENVVNIGRINEQFPIHIDLTNIVHANLISRIHASIRCEQDRYYLEDVGSSNGTWLNGTPIKPGTRFRQEIHDRDTIAFGRNQTVKFTVEINR